MKHARRTKELQFIAHVWENQTNPGPNNSDSWSPSRILYVCFWAATHLLCVKSITYVSSKIQNIHRHHDKNCGKKGGGKAITSNETKTSQIHLSRSQHTVPRSLSSQAQTSTRLTATCFLGLLSLSQVYSVAILRRVPSVLLSPASGFGSDSIERDCLGCDKMWI